MVTGCFNFSFNFPSFAVSLFKLFEPFIGEKSIQYANKGDWRSRRKQYDQVFSPSHLVHYYSGLQEVSVGAFYFSDYSIAVIYMEGIYLTGLMFVSLFFSVFVEYKFLC